MLNKRIYDDRYKAFRQSVLTRDGHKCQYPKCRKKTRLQVHHIARWADNSEIRYATANGITLCVTHHKKIKNNEHIYADLFREIIKKKTGK